MAAKRPLNDLSLTLVMDAYCFLPVGMIVELAKIRPVQSAGVMKLKGMIASSGYDRNSVLKVRAPLTGEHTHWGFEYLKKQATEGEEISKADWDEMLAGVILKGTNDWTEAEMAYLYGLIDGAHRLMALLLLVEDPKYPEYTLEYLVPCQVMCNTLPEELMIAIATRKFIKK
jgi:hypothetical protein